MINISYRTLLMGTMAFLLPSLFICNQDTFLRLIIYILSYVACLCLWSWMESQ